MGSVISPDGCFEWEEDKNILNKENHGFYFEEILGVLMISFFGSIRQGQFNLR